MQPTQFSSWATTIGNQPRRFGVGRQAKTSVGHTCRQKPHALHMSSPTITSQRPEGPFGAFFPVLKSATRSLPLVPRILAPGPAGVESVGDARTGAVRYLEGSVSIHSLLPRPS